MDFNTDMALRSMAVGVPERMIYVGVDLGKLEAHSAIVVVERVEEMPTNYVDVLRGVGVRVRFIVRYAERLALDTDYTFVVRRVKQLVGQLLTRGSCVVVVDETGVGVPVVEEMRRAGIGCGLHPVKISGGRQATAKSVPREELLGKLKMMGERGELELAVECGDGEKLRRELVYLQLGSRRGKGGEKDDLAFALALACWKARR